MTASELKTYMCKFVDLPNVWYRIANKKGRVTQYSHLNGFRKIKIRWNNGTYDIWSEQQFHLLDIIYK